MGAPGVEPGRSDLLGIRGLEDVHRLPQLPTARMGTSVGVGIPDNVDPLEESVTIQREADQFPLGAAKLARDLACDFFGSAPDRAGTDAPDRCVKDSLRPPPGWGALSPNTLGNHNPSHTSYYPAHMGPWAQRHRCRTCSHTKPPPR